MVEEVPMSVGAFDVGGLWREAATPEARRRIMNQVVLLGFDDGAQHAHRRIQEMILSITDPTERSLTAHDYVVTMISAAEAIVDVTMKILLLDEARTVCRFSFFDTPLALFGAYLFVVAVGRKKRDLVKIRDLVASMQQTDTVPKTRVWCWRELYELTACICDAERFVEAGGKWTDLGFRDVKEARNGVAAVRLEAKAANG